MNGTSVDLLALVGQDSNLKRVSRANGDEYAGPCPFCGGKDRLRVWPNHSKGPRWACLSGKAGRAGCGRGGDAIAYMVERGDLTPKQAGELRGAGEPVNTGPRIRQPRPPAPLPPAVPPGQEWQRAGRGFVSVCQAVLWGPEGAAALGWLRGRGLTDKTIKAAGLGWNSEDLWQPPELWGLEPWETDKGKPGQVWLPRGWVIPWEVGGDLWRVNIRRPNQELDKDRQRYPGREPPKYIGPKRPAGTGNALYNAAALTRERPAVLVEGEIDALTVGQFAGDLVTAVATGSTAGARLVRWVALLAACPVVLVAYDADTPGQKAAAWWLDVLPNARHWRPLWGDVNQMAQDGADLRAWVQCGLDQVPTLGLTGAGGGAGDGPNWTPGLPPLGAETSTSSTAIGAQGEPPPVTGGQDSQARPWGGADLPVRVDDLQAFEEKWGLRIVGLEWPADSPGLVATVERLSGVQIGKPENRKGGALGVLGEERVC